MRSWLADPATAMSAMVLTTVWWVTGYYLVIYLAGLQDVPPQPYEAAAIDGPSGWRRFWAITLPLLRPAAAVRPGHPRPSARSRTSASSARPWAVGPAQVTHTHTVVPRLLPARLSPFFHFGSTFAMPWFLFLSPLLSLLQFRLLRGHTEY